MLTALDEAVNAEISEDEDGWVVVLCRGTTTAVRSGMTVTVTQLWGADADGWSVYLVRLGPWVEPGELVVANVEVVTTTERARDLTRRMETHGFPDQEGMCSKLQAALSTWAGGNRMVFHGPRRVGRCMSRPSGVWRLHCTTGIRPGDVPPVGVGTLEFERSAVRGGTVP